MGIQKGGMNKGYTRGGERYTHIITWLLFTYIHTYIHTYTYQRCISYTLNLTPYSELYALLLGLFGEICGSNED